MKTKNDENPQPVCREIEKKFSYTEWLRHSDLLQGIIRIDEAIRESSTSRILSEIQYTKQRQIPNLTVIISSPGGGAYYAFAIYDALRNLSESGIKVNAIVEGWAASAAAMIILQAADVRMAYPSARFLLHECRRWIFFAIERTSDIKDEVEEMEAITKQILSMMSRRCGKTEEEIRQRIERKEIWMSASEAKDWGLIDKII